ncbi:hypothetical protein VB780_11985 [Leptolyngbya sp. CCNP1308]|nr:hypothetical protein [Leptolyngbya sp. CCNP1308]MEA5449293.1 hypothetical protein [Leptolyngbya sp. CCNP1308]
MRQNMRQNLGAISDGAVRWGRDRPGDRRCFEKWQKTCTKGAVSS